MALYSRRQAGNGKSIGQHEDEAARQPHGHQGDEKPHPYVLNRVTEQPMSRADQQGQDQGQEHAEPVGNPQLIMK